MEICGFPFVPKTPVVAGIFALAHRVDIAGSVGGDTMDQKQGIGGIGQKAGGDAKAKESGKEERDLRAHGTPGANGMAVFKMER
jgi:hypothetical protein